MKKLGVFPAILTALFLSLAAAVSAAPTPRDLPNDCAIVASEAASRLAATGAWTRIMRITLITRDGHVAGHAITVWIPPTATHVWFYDQYLLGGGGSLDLDISERDTCAIAIAIQAKLHILIPEAHFIE